MASEGHGTRKGRHHPLTYLALWWCDFCSEAARSLAKSESKNVSRSDAFYFV
jgi:hypothetical protein